jgi:hypothetical protein
MLVQIGIVLNSFFGEEIYALRIYTRNSFSLALEACFGFSLK